MAAKAEKSKAHIFKLDIDETRTVGVSLSMVTNKAGSFLILTPVSDGYIDADDLEAELAENILNDHAKLWNLLHGKSIEFVDEK
jgi:hypothetical protein